jgi:peptidoglycan-N-acetylglucosamine deacetylase
VTNLAARQHLDEDRLGMRRALCLLLLTPTVVALPAAAGSDRARHGATDPAPDRPTGCTRGGADLHTHGSRELKRIAIGFDDGPSSFTSRVLRILNRFDAHATFFVIGQEVRGRGEVMRTVLDAGNEIGNHTMHHRPYPTRADLAATNRLIDRATGFRPCLFRPPGGNVNRGLIRRADSEGLTTIAWNVDPRDWSNPGSRAIAANVIRHARRGSIVVMHDGGGNRRQTISALPRILSHFEDRGYEFVTVTELLGHEFTYGLAA